MAGDDEFTLPINAAPPAKDSTLPSDQNPSRIDVPSLRGSTIAASVGADASGIDKSCDAKIHPPCNTTGGTSQVIDLTKDASLAVENDTRRDSMDVVDTNIPAIENGNAISPQDAYSSKNPRRTKRKQPDAPTIDTSPPHSSKRARNEAQIPLFSPPSTLVPKELDRDLAGFGFTAGRKKRMSTALDKSKQDCDPAAPPQDTNEQKAGEEQKEKRNQRTRSTLTEGSRYQPLFLRKDSDWVLYDPNKTWPQHLGRKMPALIRRVATFQPNHKRILAFNLKTSDVQIRGRPNAFKGKSIEYTALGPRIKPSEEVERKTGMVDDPRSLFTPVGERAMDGEESSVEDTASELSSVEGPVSR